LARTALDADKDHLVTRQHSDARGYPATKML
jgi:hypothetical protein